jgi:hypothetical protein
MTVEIFPIYKSFNWENQESDFFDSVAVGPFLEVEIYTGLGYDEID